MVQVQIPKSKSKFDLNNLEDLFDFLDLLKRFGFEFYHYPEIEEIGIKAEILIYANFSETTAEYHIEVDNENGLYLSFLKYSEGTILYLGKKYKDYERIELEGKGIKVYYHKPYFIIKYNV